MKKKPILCMDCRSRDCVHVKGMRCLTPRQIQVVRLIGEGLSNKEIAYRMGIKCGSVKTYISDSIFPRLRLNNRVEVARYAWENAELLREPAGDVHQFPIGV